MSKLNVKNTCIVPKFFLLIYLSSVVVLSCVQSDFDGDLDTRLHIGLYDTLGQSLSTPIWSLYDVISDTTWTYSGESPVSNIQLELNGEMRTSKFFLGIDSGKYDTLQFFYTSNLHIVSYEKGVTYRYALDSVAYTKHYIDSLNIENTSIITSQVEHVQVFY